jgi:NAD+ synthetase
MLTVSLAQLRPRKGRYAENLARLGEMFREAAGLPTPPGLIVAPESALTGYFLEGGVRELAIEAGRLFEDLARVHRESGAADMDVALGFYERHSNHIYNSALYASLGGSDAGIRHVHRKVFLPTYGVFDEERFVAAGDSVQAFDTRWGRAALLICEDAWHSIVPTIAALDGAEMLIVPSASPARGLQPSGDDDERPASIGRWERIMQDIAGEHGVFVALTHLVGFEGGKAFVGGSLIAGPRGNLIVEGPVFEEALVTASLDLSDIARVRAEMPLLADLEARLPMLAGELARAGQPGDTASRGSSDPGGAAATSSSGTPPPDPRSTASPDRPAQAALSRTRRGPSVGVPNVTDDVLEIDAPLAKRWLVEFLRDELTRRRGFEKAVIGLSGGVDSALVAYLAAEALGPENVTAIRMPYRTSSAESLDHAQLVIDALGIESRTVDISAAVDGTVAAIGDTDPARKGNIMARCRMIVLFDLSAKLKALPLGTGNKSERLLGYFTWHADDSPPVNPIGDLYKTQVWALARYIGVPAAIVDKPATADLIHGQTDEIDLGVSYARGDRILHFLLSGYTPEALVTAGFTEAEVEAVRRRLDSTHWKRRLPTVAMVSQTAIGEWYLRPVDY